MDFEHLKRFITLVEIGNMTKAADMMHISQPALSRQIMQVEDEIGYKLFKREKKRLILTREGETFIEYTNEILSLLDKMELDLKEKEDKSTLVIGCTRSFLGTSLGVMTRMFLEQSPNVRLKIMMRDREGILELVEDGTVDIAMLIEQEVDSDKYYSFKLKKKYRWGIVMNSDDPLADRMELSVEEILCLPLILPDMSFLHFPADPVIESIYRNALSPVVVFDYFVNGIHYVDEKIGYMVLLAASEDIQMHHNKTYRPLIPRFEATNMLVWSKQRELTPLLDIFIRTLTIPSE